MSNGKRIATAVLLWASAAAAVSAKPLPGGDGRPVAQGDSPKQDAAAERKRLGANVTILRAASKTFGKLSKDKPPANLDAAQRKGFEEQSGWLAGAAQRMDDLVVKAQALLDGTTTQSTVEELAAMNLRFLAIQQACQAESRKYQTLSIASKARHDIALNAIRNMK